MRKKYHYPYARQSIAKEDIKAVQEALKSDMITRGKNVQAFEEAMQAYTGAKYAVMTTSGSTALFLAFQAASVSGFDRFITTPNSFIATTSAAMRLGAKPHFVDIDKKTGNVNLDLMEPFFDLPPSRGRLVIAPVHFAGCAVDMQKLDKMIKTPNSVVIEDAAHALGSFYPSGEKVGACAYSQMTIFSFHAIKNITSCEGGCVTTNDEALYKRLQLLRNSGMEKKGYTFDVKELSCNYHMTEIQAALGLSQLSRIDQFTEKRNEIRSWYKECLGSCEHIEIPSDCSKTHYHLYVIRVKKDRDSLREKLEDLGIGTQVHYRPLYQHTLLTKLYGDQKSTFPEMESYYKEALTLPFYVDLTKDDVEKISEEIKRATNS